MTDGVNTALDAVVAAMQPWATGGDYLNFADGPATLRAFDEESYARLREIRAAVDPDGLFVAAHPVV